MNGALYERCGCTETVTGPDGTARRKQLGHRCPQLRRGGGSWNPRHGTWGFQLQAPGTNQTGRIHLR